MCRQLGHNCKAYVPANDNIALLDEIPLEEDTQSVITTNSSIVGDPPTPRDDDDSDDDGGDRTPVNLSDVELDDITVPVQDDKLIEEHFSRLKLGQS